MSNGKAFALSALVLVAGIAVVAALSMASLFWKHDGGATAAWKGMIARGDTPNFGGNLLY